MTEDGGGGGERLCDCGHKQQFGKFCRNCGGVKNPEAKSIGNCSTRHTTVKSGEHCVDCGKQQ